MPDMELCPPAAQLVNETCEKLAVKTPLHFQYFTESGTSSVKAANGK